MKPRTIVAIAASLALCGLLWGVGSASEPVDLATIRQNLFDVCFISSNEGWVVGDLGRILHTTDGGKTFERLEAGTRRAFSSIACFPDRTLMLTGQSGIIYRSSDGGQSWKQAESGSERNLLSSDFATKQTGIVVGDAGIILRTEDVGVTWQQIPVPEEVPLPEEAALTIAPGDILLYDVSFPTPERGWIVGEFGVILASSDAGRTWRAQSNPLEGTLFGVTFTDAENGWAVGLSGVMVRTRNGGETWQPVNLPRRLGFDLSLYDITIQGQHGWAIGDSGLLLSSKDSGNTWQLSEVPIQLAGTWFRGVGILPDGQGLVVGADGLMLAVNQQSFVPLRKL